MFLEIKEILAAAIRSAAEKAVSDGVFPEGEPLSGNMRRVTGSFSSA